MDSPSGEAVVSQYGGHIQDPFDASTPVKQTQFDTATPNKNPFHTGLPNKTPMTLSLALPAVTPGGTEQAVTKLKSVRELPEKFRGMFVFPYFNIVQSKVFDEVLYGDKHIVLAAPTGCGKTVLLELAIIRLLMTSHENGTLPTSTKIVYMAPMKALCSERYDDWRSRFEPLGLRCQQLTGDSLLDDYYDLQDIHIILTTPEKWDSMTRRWRDNQSLVRQVALFLIDEVHLVNDSSRGATMEAVISRMKTVQASVTASRQPCRLRFLAISATAPNHEDVAAWLKSPGHDSLHFSFDDNWRPVRLRKVVLGFPCSAEQSEFRFDLSLNYKLAAVIDTYSDQKPTLVFCATRKSVQQGASILVKEARFIMSDQHKQRLTAAANALRDNRLRDVVLCGVGYHHAGMDAQDRKTIEALFSQSSLPVLLATSTLAMGVNLPAHLVVIKSTMHYVMGVYQEYSESQIMQMIGRAGRPQFDTTATAVIMTRSTTKEKYEGILNGTQLIESSLHENLVEHINAEVVLATITDVAVVADWLKSTFLYTRVMKNPRHYGIPVGLTRDQVEKKLQDMCLKAVNSLTEVGLVSMDSDGFLLTPTELGRVMARYCVAFETMKQFQQLSPTETLESLLGVLCGSQEFHDIQLRNNEKTILNNLNRHKNKVTIRFPMKGKIKTSEMKVNCLIQAQLSCLPVSEFALSQDNTKIFRSAVRLSTCLVEVVWQKAGYQCLLNAVLLAKCVRAKLWENSRHLTRQLPGIGATMSSALANAGVVSFEKILEKNPRDLELIVNRHPPFGNQIKDAVNRLPKYNLFLEQGCVYKEESAVVTVTVTLLNADMVTQPGTGKTQRQHSLVLLAGDADNNVVFKSRISEGTLVRTAVWSRRFEVHRGAAGEDLHVHLISENIVGLDIERTFTPFYTCKKPSLYHSLESSHPQPREPYARKIKTTLEFSNERPDMERRVCGHHCLDKETCAHDCCKTGVLLRRHRPSSVNLLRQDMQRRLSNLPPPTPASRRLAMRVDMSLQQYAYTPQHQCLGHGDLASCSGNEGVMDLGDKDSQSAGQYLISYHSSSNERDLCGQQTADSYGARQHTAHLPDNQMTNIYDCSDDDDLPILHIPKKLKCDPTSTAVQSAIRGFHRQHMLRGDRSPAVCAAPVDMNTHLHGLEAEWPDDVHVPSSETSTQPGFSTANEKGQNHHMSNYKSKWHINDERLLFPKICKYSLDRDSNSVSPTQRAEQNAGRHNTQNPLTSNICKTPVTTAIHSSPMYNVTTTPSTQQFASQHLTQTLSNVSPSYRHQTKTSQLPVFAHVTKTPTSQNRLVGIACRTPKSAAVSLLEDLPSPLPGTISGPFLGRKEAVLAAVSEESLAGIECKPLCSSSSRTVLRTLPRQDDGVASQVVPCESGGQDTQDNSDVMSRAAVRAAVKQDNSDVMVRAAVREDNSAVMSRATVRAAVREDNSDVMSRAAVREDNSDVMSRAAVREDNSDVMSRAAVKQDNSDVMVRAAVREDNSAVMSRATVRAAVREDNSDVMSRAAVREDNSDVMSRAAVREDNSDVMSRAAVKQDNSDVMSRAAVREDNSDVMSRAAVKQDNSDVMSRAAVKQGNSDVMSRADIRAAVKQDNSDVMSRAAVREDNSDVMSRAAVRAAVKQGSSDVMSRAAVKQGNSDVMSRAAVKQGNSDVMSRADIRAAVALLACDSDFDEFSSSPSGNTPDLSSRKPTSLWKEEDDDNDNDQEISYSPLFQSDVSSCSSIEDLCPKTGAGHAAQEMTRETRHTMFCAAQACEQEAEPEYSEIFAGLW